MFDFDWREFLTRAVTSPVWFIGVELLAAAAAVAVALCRPGLLHLPALERSFLGLAQRKTLAVVAVGGGLLLVRVALVPLIPPPEPVVHDEFCYLVGSDTFASGRLANPPHPNWRHFEVNYVLWQPHYAAKYPPAQALFLAAGQALSGRPWTGVLLSAAAMCAAVTWMLQGWFPPAWALLGGSLLALRIGIFSYWMNSYWGGAVAAMAGALVLGAYARLKRRPRARYAVLLGAGLVILGNSRPYEGLLFGIPVLSAIVAWALAHRRLAAVRAAAFTMLAVLLTGAAATSYYYWRVTGNPLLMPYVAYERQFAYSPTFFWQPARAEPQYDNDMMRRHNELERRNAYDTARSLGGFLRRNGTRTIANWSFFLGPILSVALLIGARALIGRGVRLLAVTWAVAAAGMSLAQANFPHYAAPLTAVIFALLVQAMRGAHATSERGAALVRAVPVALLAVLAVRIATQPVFSQPMGKYPPPWQVMSWCCTGPGDVRRAEILRRLEATPGRHLLFVKYAPDHDPAIEWVYNRADINRAKVVWARVINPAEDEALVRYFAGREVWEVDADEDPPRLARRSPPGIIAASPASTAGPR